MIQVYQGVDIVEVERFKKILLGNENLLDDLFTPGEKTYCYSMKDPQAHLAGHFAAKESYLKALGTGFSGMGIDHAFQEIEIVHAASGRPQVSVTGWIAKLAQKRRICQSTVSISHSGDYAMAAVVLVGSGKEG